MAARRYECILYEKINGVAVILLNWPHALNAMNQRMWTELEAAL
jgi:enoyl-CoA hydratase/carnithine racemase